MRRSSGASGHRWTIFLARMTSIACLTTAVFVAQYLGMEVRAI
jgi:hypothetical protein